MNTIKQITITESSPHAFQIVRKSMDHYKPSWDITEEALSVLAMVAPNPGKLLHALDTIDPQDGEIITIEVVRQRLPSTVEMGYRYEHTWDAMWEEFRVKDQRRVFKIGSTVPA